MTVNDYGSGHSEAIVTGSARGIGAHTDYGLLVIAAQLCQTAA